MVYPCMVFPTEIIWLILDLSLWFERYGYQIAVLKDLYIFYMCFVFVV